MSFTERKKEKEKKEEEVDTRHLEAF